MTISNLGTGSNFSSPFVFLYGGAGMGQVWQPHIAQLIDFHSPVFDPSRQGQEGKKAAEVQLKKIKKWLPIVRRAEPRMMEQCCTATCLAAA
jgi:hypothetical protein